MFTTLEAEGLDLQFVVRDGAAPTGAFFKWRSEGRSSVSYLRHGSAASHLVLEDVPASSFEGIELVHLTGITMALSETARAVVVKTARRARTLGLVVIFDPNYRPPLWVSPEAAGRACRELFPYVDWLLCGREEGAAIFGVDDPGDLVDALAGDGVDAVVRVGDRGAVLAGPRGPAAVVPPPGGVGGRRGWCGRWVRGRLLVWSPGGVASGSVRARRQFDRRVGAPGEGGLGDVSPAGRGAGGVGRGRRGGERWRRDAWVVPGPR